MIPMTVNRFIICKNTGKHYLFLHRLMPDGTELCFMNGTPFSAKDAAGIYDQLQNRNVFLVDAEIESAEEAECLRLYYLNQIDKSAQSIEDYYRRLEVQYRNTECRNAADTLAQVFDLPDVACIPVLPGDKVRITGREDKFTDHLNGVLCTVVAEPDEDFGDDPVVIDPNDPELNRFVYIDRADVHEIERELPRKFRMVQETL